MQIRCQKGAGTNAQMFSLVFEYLFFHHYQKSTKKKKIEQLREQWIDIQLDKILTNWGIVHVCFFPPNF